MPESLKKARFELLVSYMNIIKKLYEPLTSIIKEKELGKITEDVVEALLDSKTTDEFLKGIPLLSSFVGLAKATLNIQSALFTKKILYFLKELQSVPQDQRVEQIIKIEDAPKYKTKVGEKILYIIEKCDDLDKAEMVGKLFRAYLKRDITYEGFLSCIACVERTSLPSLLTFISSEYLSLKTNKGGSEYLTSGLMELIVEDPKIKVEPNRYSTVDELSHKIVNFSIECWITEEGSIIRNCLQ